MLHFLMREIMRAIIVPGRRSHQGHVQDAARISMWPHYLEHVGASILFPHIWKHPPTNLIVRPIEKLIADL